MENIVRLAFISDTHLYLGRINIPKCDILVHAGDLTQCGNLSEIAIVGNQFKDIIESGDAEKIVFIGGNHDEMLEKNPYMARDLMKGRNIYYLENQSLELDGIKFYGSPYTPEFFNWSFMYKRGAEAKKIWNKIPEDTDILVTHGMPYGIFDEIIPRKLKYDEFDPHVGCKDLRNRIKVVKPRIYCGGHLHLRGGQVMTEDGTMFINAAICDDSYIPNRRPIVVDYNTETKEVKLFSA